MNSFLNITVDQAKDIFRPFYRYIKYLISIFHYLSIKDKRKQLSVLDSWQTIDYINSNHCSISRFGDGELDLLLHEIYGVRFYSNFQEFDSSLAKRLSEILKYKNPTTNHIVGLPACMINFGTKKLKQEIAEFWNRYSFENIDRLLTVTSHDHQYIDTNFTRFYMDYKNTDHCKAYISKLKTLWKDRNLLIVEGDKTRLGIGNDLFSTAISIRRILCPSINAFHKYDEILETVEKYAYKDDMIIIALGMTATILAYDLAIKGYQALDMGHIDIEYEWYKLGAKEKVPIKDKFTNEVSTGRNVKDITDKEYNSQIIARIT